MSRVVDFFAGTSPQRSRTERIARVVTSGLVTAALAGVAVSGLSAWRMAATPDLPERDLHDWVMPLDQYIPISSEVHSYAENLMVKECMERGGHEWPVPWRDYKLADYETDDTGVDPQRRRPLGAGAAAEHGYHRLVVSERGRAETMELNSRPITATTEVAFRGCLKHVRAAQPVAFNHSGDAGHTAIDLYNTAYEEALRDEGVVAAAKKWVDCMRGEGIDDLPSTPDQMPSLSMRRELRIDVPTIPVGDEESRLAMKDVRCQGSSGYLRALYDAEWSRQAMIPERASLQLHQVGGSVAEQKRLVLEGLDRLDVEGE